MAQDTKTKVKVAKTRGRPKSEARATAQKLFNQVFNGKIQRIKDQPLVIEAKRQEIKDAVMAAFTKHGLDQVFGKKTNGLVNRMFREKGLRVREYRPMPKKPKVGFGLLTLAQIEQNGAPSGNGVDDAKAEVEVPTPLYKDVDVGEYWH